MARSCGAVQNYFRQVDLFPELRVNQARLESQTRRALRRGATRDFPRDIPVVVHVLYQTDQANITDEQVASQIEVLNEDYGGTNADITQVPAPFDGLVGKAGLSFHLAQQDPDGNPTSGITRTKTKKPTTASTNSMKKDASGGKDAWDAKRYLNIWVCRLRRWRPGLCPVPRRRSGSPTGWSSTPGLRSEGSARSRSIWAARPPTRSGTT